METGTKTEIEKKVIEPIHVSIAFICRICGSRFRFKTKHRHFKQHGLRYPIKGIHFVIESEWDGKIIKRVKRSGGGFRLLKGDEDK